MSDHDLEQISAFVDGETPEGEVSRIVDKLEADAVLQKHWHRYHLIGDAMRNNLPAGIKTSLAARVAKVLENEPPILAPHPITSLKPKPPSQRSAVGYAIAASIAVLGFVVVGLIGTRPESPSETPSQVAVNTVKSNVIAPTMPVASFESVAANDHDLSGINDPDTPHSGSPNIHAYVVSHEQASAVIARPGLPPNVRVVTFSQPAQ